jgi:hypothetical protein
VRRALLLAALSSLLLAAFVVWFAAPMARPALGSAAHLCPTPLPSIAAPVPVPVPALSAVLRADRALVRDGYTLVGAGALFVPSSFHSEDGVYDLVIHFHGNAALVAESFSAAGVNALLLVVNVGIGSGPYEERYAPAVMLDVELDRVRAAAEARGLRGAYPRRLALSAWSAGYGAIRSILGSETGFRRTSAVLLCDALHAGFTDPQERAIDMARLDSFVRFARAAANGEKLMTMTHSEVGERRYATSTETADAILREVSAFREGKLGAPPHVDLLAAQGVMAKPRWLEQLSEARLGLLHVRGYGGSMEDNHIAHLAQMSVTVLPELVAYWK